MAAEILCLSALEIAESVRCGRITAEQVLDAYLGRISSVEPKVHAFLTIPKDRARLAARRVDEMVRSGGDPGPLSGVPIAVKDNIATRGLRTTSGSRILEQFVPMHDATAVKRIEDAGALVIGKTNLDEFGMGSSTEHSAFGPTMNPWSLDRVPGGSSGGSSAAVAAGMATLALGTDTGGSVRQPAGFCGLVGCKPQYGSVSRWGLTSFASSLDVIGPMARDARDCAHLLNTLQGHDRHDSTSLPRRARIDLDTLERPVKGMTLGLPKGWGLEGLGSPVHDALDRVIDSFTNAGVSLVLKDLPLPSHAISCYYLLANAEASSNLARFDGVRYGHRSNEVTDLESLYCLSRGKGLGTEVKRRILIGTYALSSGYYDEYYVKAQRAREQFRIDFAKSMRDCDAILLPTSPTPAFRLGEKIRDPLTMYLSDLFTILPNLLEVPAVSFPGVPSKDCLPVGLQLYGKGDDEETLLRFVRAYEKRTDWVASVRDGRGPATGPIGNGD